MSQQGEREVVAEVTTPSGMRWGLSRPGLRGLELIAPDALEREIAFDTRNFAGRQALMETARAASPGVVAPSPLARFISALPPMQAARAQKALDKVASFSGEFQPRWVHVVRRVEAGACVEGDARGERRLVATDGTFYQERDITTAAMDFAEHLGGRCRVK